MQSVPDARQDRLSHSPRRGDGAKSLSRADCADAPDSVDILLGTKPIEIVTKSLLDFMTRDNDERKSVFISHFPSSAASAKRPSPAPTQSNRCARMNRQRNLASQQAESDVVQSNAANEVRRRKDIHISNNMKRKLLYVVNEIEANKIEVIKV